MNVIINSFTRTSDHDVISHNLPRSPYADSSEDEVFESEDEYQLTQNNLQSSPSIHTSYSSTTSGGLTLELLNKSPTGDKLTLIKVEIPEQRLKKCLQFKSFDTVWAAKQRIIQSLAKKLTDPLNYGLYDERSKSFLKDHHLLSKYIELGSTATYQMKMKNRTLNENKLVARDMKQVAKMQTSAKKREFVSFVQQFNSDKIYYMLKKGLDPNFHCPNTGETPLTILCGDKFRPDTATSVFMALKIGGAHLDFRNEKGHTPMHVAARTGNLKMLQELLECKAYTDVFDGRELTPLYHCMLLGSDPEVAKTLLSHGAKYGVTDPQKWNEAHQACRHGRHRHLLELFSHDHVTKELLNSQNASGNTPLHVCALYNQTECAAILLRKGCDVKKVNYANQDSTQVAHVAGNCNLANIITNFQKADNTESGSIPGHECTIDLPEPPSHEPPKPPAYTNHHMTWAPKTRSSPLLGALMKKNAKRKSLDGSESITNAPEHRYSSALPPNAMILEKKSSETNGDVHHKKDLTNEGTMVIVIEDYLAIKQGYMSLRVGDRVTVLNNRLSPPGHYEGIIGSQRGFFPQECVEEVKLRNHGNTRNSVSSINSDSISLKSFNSSENFAVHRVKSSDKSSLDSRVSSTSHAGVYHNARDVTLYKGNDGYGFVLRGAKAINAGVKFKPSPTHPAAQYLESIDEGSNAYNAGLRSGDFILKIGEKDVRLCSHKETVEIVRKYGEPLHMQVVTVIKRRTTEDDDIPTRLSQAGSEASGSPKSKGKGHSPSQSISSALGTLDNVLDMEETSSNHGNEDDSTATLSRRPRSRLFYSNDLKDMFVDPSHAPPNRRNTTHISGTSTFTGGRRALKVETPAIPVFSNTATENTSSFQPATKTTWSHSVSAATGQQLLLKDPRKKPPPPKRAGSKLSVSMEDDIKDARSALKQTRALPKEYIPETSTSQTQITQEAKISPSKTVTSTVVSPSKKPSALILALAAKANASKTKQPNNSPPHTLNSITNIPPPATPPSPVSEFDNIPSPPSLYDLPPPPPADEHKYNNLAFDQLMVNLPPPPENSSTFNDVSGIMPPAQFNADAMTGDIPAPPRLPPPPVPPTEPETTLTSVDNVSNADSGVADVTGDGLCGFHPHTTPNSISDSNSTASNNSSDDYSPMKSKQESELDAVGNMYLGVLNKNKGKVKTANTKPKQEQVTRMTFAPPKKTIAKNLPPPLEEKSEKSPPSENKTIIPPTPTQFLNEVKTNGEKPNKSLPDWSVDDVCDWLKELGLSMYEESFRENEISGEHLPELGKEELLEMGIKRLGHRLTFEKGVKKLQTA